MASEKCFCHLGGFKVKDADARKRLDGVETMVRALIASGGMDGSGGVAAPAYVTVEAHRVAAMAHSRQNENTITFLTCSDLHYSSVSYNSAQLTESIAHLGQAMEIVRKNVHCDFAAMLGDMVWDGGETPEQAMAAVRFVNSCLFPGFNGIPNFRARGNHDSLYHNDTGLTDQQIFSNVGAFNAGAAYDTNNRLGGYCYRDFESLKLRVVCINTSETDDGGFAVSDAQNTWLQAALDLTAKGTGWRSVVIGHHPPDWIGSASALVQTLQAASGLICVFHGHVHGYKVDLIPGTNIPRIAIPNACFGRENEYGENGSAENADGTEFGEETTYSKTASSNKDTAFCVVTIDLAAERIYADHYGAGYGRVIGFDGTVIETYTAETNSGTTNYSIAKTLSNINCSNAATEVSSGAEYVAELSAADGYTFGSVTVKMGGVDVTASAFYGGRIKISAVTGDIVITATAVKLSGDFDNLVPSSGDFDGSGVFNGSGYMDGVYISTEAPYYKADPAGTTSGLIAYNVYGEGVSANYQPPTIYIRGVDFNTDENHCRIGFFNEARECRIVLSGALVIPGTTNTLLTFYDVEKLGTLYYKLTPKMNESGENIMAASGFYKTTSIAITAHGLGANMIVALDEEIK